MQAHHLAAQFLRQPRRRRIAPHHIGITRRDDSLEFLLAGFGWGTMPQDLERPHIDAGSLVRLAIDDPSVLPGSIGLFAIHDRQRPLSLGARQLLAALQRQAWFRVC